MHLAVDTSTHEIVAAELSLSNVTDAEVLPNLLKQKRRRIIEISGDGAYDTRDCYDAIRFKRAVPLLIVLKREKPLINQGLECGGEIGI